MALEALRRYAESQNIITNENNESEFTNVVKFNEKIEFLKNDIIKKIEEGKDSIEIINDCIECIGLLTKDTSFKSRTSIARIINIQNDLF